MFRGRQGRGCLDNNLPLAENDDDLGGSHVLLPEDRSIFYAYFYLSTNDF